MRSGGRGPSGPGPAGVEVRVLPVPPTVWTKTVSASPRVGPLSVAFLNFEGGNEQANPPFS